MDKTHHLYISYSWQCHPTAFKKKTEFFLRERLNFKYLEAYNAENTTNLNTENLIEKVIKDCDCILLLAGVDTPCYEWLEFEIEYAKKHQKPIIAIAPWLNKEIVDLIKNNADKTVNWHSKSIVDAIKQLTSSSDF